MEAYIFLSLTILLTGLSQLLQKKHAISTGYLLDAFGVTVRLSKHLVWAIITLVLAMAFWILTLNQMPLSVAYPLMSLNYVLVIWIGSRFFNEPLSKSNLSGVLLIILGVTLLGGH